MDEISDIQAYYDGAWDNEDNRLNRHQLEHDITWLYLEKYLPLEGSYLLEIGAATGRYTLELARRGYKVLAVDLSPQLVNRARDRAIEAGLGDRIEFRVGDARILKGIDKSVFDGALVMGPFYHLIEREDRVMALERVFESLISGGIVFTSWISRFGIFNDLIKNLPGWIENTEEVNPLLERGCDPERHRDDVKGNFRWYFALAEEINPIHQETGFHTLALAASEPCISADDASYNMLQGQHRELWLDLLFRLSSEPSMVASSRHLLYCGKKPEKSDDQM